MSEQRKLSPRETEVLNFLIRYHKLHGEMPLTRDIQSGLGWSSLNHVSNCTSGLMLKGYISKEPRKFRGIKVLKNPDGTQYGTREQVNTGILIDLVKRIDQHLARYDDPATEALRREIAVLGFSQKICVDQG